MLFADEPIFHRPALARYFVDFLKSADSASGLFLSAPRRTGKTTFIKQDIVPILRAEGATVIYADLWEQKEVNPAIVIVNAIREAIMKADGVVMKTMKTTGITKFKLGGIEMDLSKIGSQDGESISKVLQHLATATNNPIVMVIDEAQHAQTTEEGRQTLFALKAARDAMKGAGGPGFRMLATGSDSDKLATLVNAKDQAFFMAPLESLDPLGPDYLQWVLDAMGRSEKPTLKALEAGFAMCSHRPEPLRRVLRALTKPYASSKSVDERFLDLMTKDMQAARETFLQGLNGMDPLDAAVLKRMASTGKNFKPFDPKTLDIYRELMTGAALQNAAPSTSSVQASLERLRKDGLVWNAGRGLWYIEDAQHVAWIVAATTRDAEAAKRAEAARLAIDSTATGIKPPSAS